MNKVLAGLVIIISSFHPSRSGSEVSDLPYTFPKEEGTYKFVGVITSKAGVCTATILTTDWILTAAHCMYYNKKQIANKDARIYMGIVNYELLSSKPILDTSSTDIKIHPRFWEKKVAKWDIALVRLYEQMKFPNDLYGSISLAKSGWPQGNLSAGLECTVLGFGGIRSTAPLTKDLKEWKVLAQHGSKACPCARRYQYKRLVCLKENAPTICRGDDGAPLVCGGEVYAIAHMVWGAACEEPIHPTDKCYKGPKKGYSVFTYLCPAHEWLNKVIPNISTYPIACSSTPLTSHLITTLLVTSLKYFTCHCLSL